MLDNHVSIEFTPQEESDLDDALTTIEKVLAPKVINLTPDERQRYARVDNKTENWITKTQGYMEQKPELVPFYVDKAEFDKDLDARKSIKPRLNRVASMLESMEDTNMLISTDVYTAAVAFYRNVKNAASQNVPGITSIYEDLKEQFPGRPKSVTGTKSFTEPSVN